MLLTQTDEQQNSGPPETARKSQIYRIEGFKGRPQLFPLTTRETLDLSAANVRISHFSQFLIFSSQFIVDFTFSTANNCFGLLVLINTGR